MSSDGPSTSQSSFAIYDERRWAIVVVKPPEAAFDDASFAEHALRLVAYFERRQDFAFVVDVRHAAPVTAAQRRALAELLDDCALKHPSIKNYTAIIIASAIQRGIVKTISWMAGQPSQTQVFASLDDGIAWCAAMLAGRDAKQPSAQR